MRTRLELLRPAVVVGELVDEAHDLLVEAVPLVHHELGPADRDAVGTAAARRLTRPSGAPAGFLADWPWSGRASAATSRGARRAPPPCNGCYDTGTTSVRTGPSRARRRRDGGLSKHGSRIDSPANPRSQSRASCRRPVSTLKTHKRRPFGRTSAPPTQRDASACGLVPVNLTYNLGYYTTKPPRAPPPQPFDAAAPKDAAAAPPRKR